MAKVDVIRHYSRATGTLIQSFLERHNHRLEIFRQNGLVYFGVRAELEEIQLFSQTVKARADVYIPLSDMPWIIRTMAELGIAPVGTIDERVCTPVEGQGTKAVIPEIIAKQGETTKLGCYSRRPNGDVHGFRGGAVFVEVQTPKDGQQGWAGQPVMEAFELHLGMNGTPIEANVEPIPDGFGFVIVFNEMQAGDFLRRLMNLQQRLEYTIHGQGPRTRFALNVDAEQYEKFKEFTPV